MFLNIKTDNTWQYFICLRYDSHVTPPANLLNFYIKKLLIDLYRSLLVFYTWVPNSEPPNALKFYL